MFNFFNQMNLSANYLGLALRLKWPSFGPYSTS